VFEIPALGGSIELIFAGYPQDFCTTNFGAGYVPVYDATGAFNGNCMTPPVKSMLPSLSKFPAP